MLIFSGDIKRSVKTRLGNQLQTVTATRSERLGITMSDFSSDGMSEDDSTDNNSTDDNDSQQPQDNVEKNKTTKQPGKFTILNVFNINNLT